MTVRSKRLAAAAAIQLLYADKSDDEPPERIDSEDEDLIGEDIEAGIGETIIMGPNSIQNEEEDEDVIEIKEKMS